MDARKPSPYVGILAPVGAATLAGLHVGEGFDTYVGGRPEDIEAMLSRTIQVPGGRIAVAVGKGARIVGYLSAGPPERCSRLDSSPWVMELNALEVAHGYRDRGLFTELFARLFRKDLEAWILYLVGNPSLRQRGETKRDFRIRLEGVLGSVGFTPLPTDDPELRPEPGSTFFARVGRGVPQPDVDDFFLSLRRWSETSVSISVRDSMLRNLLRDDLERSGFRVSATSAGGASGSADVVISDTDRLAGRRLTVRLNGSGESRFVNGTLWHPLTQADRLGEILRSQLEKVRPAHG